MQPTIQLANVDPSIRPAEKIASSAPASAPSASFMSILQKEIRKSEETAPPRTESRDLNPSNEPSQKVQSSEDSSNQKERADASATNEKSRSEDAVAMPRPPEDNRKTESSSQNEGRSKENHRLEKHDHLDREFKHLHARLDHTHSVKKKASLPLERKIDHAVHSNARMQKADAALFDFMQTAAKSMAEKTTASHADLRTEGRARSEKREKTVRPAAPENQVQRVRSDKEVQDSSKSSREKPVVLQLERSKWEIQEAPRQAQKEFQNADGRPAKGETRAEARIRMDKNLDRSTPVFAELLKPQIAPAEREKLAHDTKDLFNQLVQKARVNYGSDGSTHASIRLRPEQLGNVTLNLKVNGSAVEARLLVENDSVRKLVNEEIDSLQRELKRQGFSVDAIEIRVRDPQMDSQSSFNPETAARFGNEQRGEFSDREARDSSWSVDPVVLPETVVAQYEAAAAWEGELNIAV
ncbi:MAG: flagellar hook-length control protein FliK [Leptospirales bacterium]|nr:flagellar hook-length control protein FliK [Leptospirales bacterium]